MIAGCVMLAILANSSVTIASVSVSMTVTRNAIAAEGTVRISIEAFSAIFARQSSVAWWAFALLSWQFFVQIIIFGIVLGESQLNVGQVSDHSLVEVRGANVNLFQVTQNAHELFTSHDHARQRLEVRFDDFNSSVENLISRRLTIVCVLNLQVFAFENHVGSDESAAEELRCVQQIVS